MDAASAGRALLETKLARFTPEVRQEFWDAVGKSYLQPSTGEVGPADPLAGSRHMAAAAERASLQGGIEAPRPFAI